MNNDLISRSVLLKEVNLTFDAFIRDAYFSAACDAMRARSAVTHLLNDAPAVDAEPVVRCRECKYGIASKFRKKEPIMMICTHTNMFPTRTDVDFFCAYGEKMDTEVEG